MFGKNKEQEQITKGTLPLEKVAATLAGQGVPTLVFISAIGTANAAGAYGAAAITMALSMLGGPVGMIGGVSFLLMSSKIASAVTKYGFDALFTQVVKNLYKNGESKKSILAKIEDYPISKDLKRKLKEEIKRR
ncbi:MAG: hypothetical protein LUG66_01470 [Clostridiales bacterium]|nr:hypothetical protein [Clostridiales bacterium]